MGAKPSAPTYLRFVVADRDPDSGRRTGLFQALDGLRRRGVLDPVSDGEYEVVRQWFNAHLARPERLSPSRRHHGKPQAISWFKSAAAAHIGKMREFEQLLERHGIAVEVIRTERPGYILYEDEFQVAAYPFADTPT